MIPERYENIKLTRNFLKKINEHLNQVCNLLINSENLLKDYKFCVEN